MRIIELTQAKLKWPVSFWTAQFSCWSVGWQYLHFFCTPSDRAWPICNRVIIFAGVFADFLLLQSAFYKVYSDHYPAFLVVTKYHMSLLPDFESSKHSSGLVFYYQVKCIRI